MLQLTMYEELEVPFLPYFSREERTCLLVRPVWRSVLNSRASSSISRVHAYSIIDTKVDYSVLTDLYTIECL